MASLKSPLKWKEFLGIICTSVLALGMCQDRIIASNTNLDENVTNSTEENSIIPESLLIQLETVQNVSDLFHRFVDINQQASIHGPAVSSMDNTNGRRALAAAVGASISSPANCDIEQKVVELDKPENGAIIFHPYCVRVRRCGGCCRSALHSCKPRAISIVNVTVIQLFYNHENPSFFEYQGTRIFSLEQHDRCECSCKQVAEDCNQTIHEYHQDECRCVCKNVEEAAPCAGPKKVWDGSDCKCKCKKVRDCSTGKLFNADTCRCEVERRSLAVLPVDQQNSTVSSTSQIPTISP